MSPGEEIYTVRELSEHLRVHPTTIYRLLRRGLIPGFRVGNTWRFRRAAIEKWERGEVEVRVALPKNRDVKRK
jgi:excisionase family DNA binding protein